MIQKEVAQRIAAGPEVKNMVPCQWLFNIIQNQKRF